MEYIKNLSKKKIITGIIILLVIIALPVTIFTVQNRQNIASLAGNPVTLTLQPASSSLTINETKDIQVILKAGAISVQSAEFSLTYGQPGQNILNAEFIPNPNSGFSPIHAVPVETNTSAKTITYKLAVSVQTAPISGDIILGTLKLTGVNTGSAAVSFTNAAFNELSGELTPTFVNGTYTVTTAQSTGTSPSITSGAGTIQITTQSVTNKSTNSATARALVNPGGKSVNVYFKYGPTNGQCSSLSSTSSVIGNTNPNATTSRSISITGLTANTTYYICAIAKDNANGALTFGNVVSFTTNALAGTTQAPSAVPSTIAASPSVSSPVTTSSPIPVSLTPLPSPNATQADINLTLKLPGIGNNAGGSKSLGENNSPQNMTRTFEVFLFNTDGQQTGNAFPAQLTYSPQEGAFKGTVRISGVPLNTAYSIKVKSNNSLARNIGIVNNLASGQTISINANNPSGELVTGKINPETPNLIGVQDYNDFMNCYNNLSSCTAATRAKADFTDDSKIDLKDLNILLYAFANRQGD